MISKKNESFPWILPKQDAKQEQENVIVLDEKRKKKASIPKVKKEMDEIFKVKGVKRKKKEWIVFVLFAVIIGTGLGCGLLQLIKSPPEQVAITTTKSANVGKVTVTLESLEVAILQNGVFTDEKRAKNVTEQLLAEGMPATVIEREKAYVVSGVASDEEALMNMKSSDGVYSKVFVIPTATLKERSKEEREQMILIRDSLEKMLQLREDMQQQEWNELGKQVKKLKKITSNKNTEKLSENMVTAYEILMENKGEVNTKTQQALLDCVSQYQAYILKGSK